MRKLTVKDTATFKKVKPKLRGARLDFRWSVKVSCDGREKLMTELMQFIREENLVLSGFGDASYSGIVSSDKAVVVLRKKLIRLASWKKEHSDKFNLFRTGKIQWVDDIFFE